MFAFVQFDNIKSVVRALHEMDGENVGSCKVKVTSPVTSRHVIICTIHACAINIIMLRPYHAD